MGRLAAIPRRELPLVRGWGGQVVSGMKRKTKAKGGGPLLHQEAHPLTPALRRRRPLILPRFLTGEAGQAYLDGDECEHAFQIVKRWAEMESQGHLDQRETALDAQFLSDIFGKGLGYKLSAQSPEDYHLELQFPVSGVGTADGALGQFSTQSKTNPVAVIELKDATTNLDTDRFNGRTPVQQCWDYMNALPECSWGIVSNFVSIRLYHRDSGSQRFEHFTLQELCDRSRFLEFYCLLERGGLIDSRVRRARAGTLLKRSAERQREVGDELYETYNRHRLSLVEHLVRDHAKTLDDGIRIAQKLLDRIIFIAFCEDRGLLAGRVLEKTFEHVSPFARVTNPRWQNFLDLFRAIDTGHRNMPHVNGGYNGGLFRHDTDVDDLQLDDEWTHFFKEVGSYDFSEEINVDVLGHLFERSITDLERLRTGGLFHPDEPSGPAGRMKKSAQRKRQGIYYTPPQFTQLIVRETIGVLIEQRLRGVADRHGVDYDDPGSTADTQTLHAWCDESIAELRRIKVVDPACGSGAFLIAAYDALEDAYGKLGSLLDDGRKASAPAIIDQFPDFILSDNLYGVDLSPEAVEITQLALWIRSARRGCTLADLAGNIVCGNSLVTDTAVHERAMNWKQTFPAVFDAGGFDCVIGNPPWERLKLQEREFFAASAPDIAQAVSAAERRKLIVELEKKQPELYARYLQAKRSAESVLGHVRSSGEFPLTAKGDINTYVLFAELARKIVHPDGRVGVLVPSGIASDNSTKEFFNALIDEQALIKLYDFENKRPFFPDVHRAFKFSTLVFGGADTRTESPDFVFFAHCMEDLEDKNRHIPISASDMALMNPNTRTCPIFRTRRDAELTRAIYRHVPVLVEESRGERGNPWGVKFLRMFDQTNDAELFHTAEQLKELGFKQRGNRWSKRKQVFLPLYEAKMIQAYDHRAAGVVVEKDNWMRQGQTEPTSLVSHQKAEFTVQPRWWVTAEDVAQTLGDDPLPEYLVFKDVTSPTNERTMISAFLPRVGLVNSAPLILTSPTISVRLKTCLLANLNSFVLDFVARQKIGNVHLNFFLIRQFAMLAPDAYADRCPWKKRQTFERWISDRVLKLTCTADDMVPLAEAAGFEPRIHKWKPQDRAELRAELDAAYFILYGIDRDDAEYILSTFKGTQRRDEAETGTFRTSELILAKYDDLMG